MLPDFLIVGAVKSGTTALHAHLRRHPDVFLPVRKELAYFVEEHNWLRGQAWYESFFDDPEARRASAVGEATPTYAWYPAFPGVPERIATIPDARIVYLVRDPLERIRSLHAQAWLGGERRPLDECVRAVPDYVDTGRYDMQLGRYLDRFDTSRVLVVAAESLHDEPSAAVGRVARFLGVRDDVAIEAGVVANPTRPRAAEAGWPDEALRPRTHRVLADLLGPEVEGILPWLPAPPPWSVLG